MSKIFNVLLLILTVAVLYITYNLYTENQKLQANGGADVQETLNKQIGQLSQDKNKLQRDLAAARSRSTSLENTNIGLQQQVEQLRQNASSDGGSAEADADLQALYFDASDQLDQATARIAQLEQTIQAGGGSIADANSGVLQQQVVALQTQNTELTTRLGSMASQLSALKSAFEQGGAPPEAINSIGNLLNGLGVPN